MALLLVQMTTVLLTALVCGWLARKLGQARVIGEIIGGILIGPSVFGRLAPQASAMLFPLDSLGEFEIMSTASSSFCSSSDAISTTNTCASRSGLRFS